VVESLASNPTITAISHIENSRETIHLPKEVERLLEAAIRCGVDEALQASGVKIPAPRE
jgi:hypothetical protein